MMVGKVKERSGVYPIVLKWVGDSYYVRIPDFDMSTQGETVSDAIGMARDAIGLMGIDMEDEGIELPAFNNNPVKADQGDIVTYVDINFDEYRKRVDNKAVKKNCTIPYWISVEAERANINYSKVLQEALINILGLNKSTVKK